MGSISESFRWTTRAICFAVVPVSFLRILANYTCLATSRHQKGAKTAPTGVLKPGSAPIFGLFGSELNKACVLDLGGGVGGEDLGGYLVGILLGGANLHEADAGVVDQQAAEAALL